MKVSFQLRIPLPNLNIAKAPGGGSIFFSANGMAVFDKSIIKTNWGAINRGPMRRAGLLVRRIMRNSIRKVKSDRARFDDYLSGKTKTFRRGKPSRPGTPPRSRSARLGHPFKKIYSVPVGDDRVVVGHVGWKRKPQTPMSMHEFGERAKIKVPHYSRVRRTRKRRSSAERLAIAAYYKANKSKNRAIQHTTTKTVTMPKRPFARPALEKAEPMFAGMWKDSVPKLSTGVGK